MKRLFFSCICSLLGFISCDYDNGWDGYKENLTGGAVQMVIVSPSTKVLYIDSELPTMHYYVAPSGAADTTVTWISDKPEILAVNAQTGVLSWGTPVNSEVTISAVSNSNDQAVGKCVFTVRNVRGLYQYVDLRKQAGLWMLDRSIGANSRADGSYGNLLLIPGCTWCGNYYQYGKNDPVANWEKGGNDGKGGKWDYKNGYMLEGGYPSYDPYWDTTKEGFVDWKDPENLPDAMEGWRLPTKEELEKLAYYLDESNFRDAQGKGAVKVLKEDLAFGPSGLVGGEDNHWTYSHYSVWCQYLWSSDYNPDTQKAWVLKVSEGGAEVVEISTIGVGAPMRFVREAASFDGGESNN